MSVTAFTLPGAAAKKVVWSKIDEVNSADERWARFCVAVIPEPDREESAAAPAAFCPVCSVSRLPTRAALGLTSAALERAEATANWLRVVAATRKFGPPKVR